MRWLFDLLYLASLILVSPWLLYRACKTGRYRHGLREKLLGVSSPQPAKHPAWFHGVSVGEIHLLRPVVAAFRQRHPHQPCAISTTTDTGLAEARKWFADLPVFFFPFDFSWAVARTLRQVDPALVVLAESELWPNFLIAARRRHVPVAIINGRMSPRSFARWRRLSPLPRWLLGHVDLLAVQSKEYAGHFRQLGAPPARIQVTGSVKFDGCAVERTNPRTAALRRLLNVADTDLVWVAGSTAPGEEAIVLDVFRELQPRYPHLRLILAPRHPERFNEVAGLLQTKRTPFVRRSQLAQPLAARAPIVLADSMGELSALWGLADLAFVGGSLDGKRGGQNMIEPAGYGAAVLFGPHVWNFRETARRLVEAGGAIQIADGAELECMADCLAGSAPQRERMGQAGRHFVLSQQGATNRTINLLTAFLSDSKRHLHAA
jgi:3-deoxy-D-manno-octulosonic-acid transferase